MKNTVKKYTTSAIQQQFWMLNQFYPESPAYNMPSVFEIKGRLDIHLLKQSINNIIKRYDIFRTVFSIEDSRLMQLINIGLEAEMPILDLSSFSDTKTWEKLSSIIANPFNLDNGPLIRVHLILKNKDTYILCIVMHHIITDLRSKELFSLELSKLYNNNAINKKTINRSDKNQYYKYTQWEQKWILDPEHTKMLDFWKNYLSKSDFKLELPLDFERPAALNLTGSACFFELPEELSNNIFIFSREQGIIPFVVLLTALFILLFKLSEQREIIIGVPFTNRRMPEHKNIPGCFVNILPLLINKKNTLSILNDLQSVRKQLLLIHRNQEISITEIINELSISRTANHNPVFQTGFTMEPPMELKLDKLDIKSIPVHNKSSQLDIFLTMWDSNSRIYGRMEFNKNLFKKESILNWINDYKNILQNIIQAPDKKINLLLLKGRSNLAG